MFLLAFVLFILRYMPGGNMCLVRGDCLEQKVTFSPLGDSAIRIEFGKKIDYEIQHKIRMLANYIEENSFHGFIECVSAYTSLTVFYSPFIVWRTYKKAEAVSPYEIVKSMIVKNLTVFENEDDTHSRIVTIPVCYGGELGPDLEEVARYNQLTTSEVVHIHTNGEYLVYMIGFCPGFPFLGGMSDRIATPRRSSPRLSIPKGSVGIAGMQTGVYPISTPGGWQLIGRTPLQLFLPKQNPPTLLQAGDRVKFHAISYEEYQAFGEGEV